MFSSRASVLHEVHSAEFRSCVGADAAEQLERLGATMSGVCRCASAATSRGHYRGRGAGRRSAREELLPLIGEVAERAGLALENARLHMRQRETQAQLRQSAERAMVLAELSHALGRPPTPTPTACATPPPACSSGTSATPA